MSCKCPQCGHTGDAAEFQQFGDDVSPDLVDAGHCPECGHFSDLEEFEAD